MGCDIHLITQIRKNGTWEYIPKKPVKFTNRNYTLFGFLADVRVSAKSVGGFYPKGLPDDMRKLQFEWDSEMSWLLHEYSTGSEKCYRFQDGSLAPLDDPRCERIFFSEEEVENIPQVVRRWSQFKWDQEGKPQRLIHVSSPVFGNAEVVCIPYHEKMSFGTFLNQNADSIHFDLNQEDIGFYRVDFACSDYHSHSYLTLKELAAQSKKKYKKYCKNTFDYWSWETDALKCGIKELKKIAKQYDVKEEDIRIVFAFDS